MAMLTIGSLSTVVWSAEQGAAPSARRVRTGAEVLIARQLAPIKGKRVGLITNQTGTVGGEHLVDILARSKDTRVVAIFAPEHGFRGEAEAGRTVHDGVDPSTGIRVFSIYGSTKKPTPAMLRGIDVLMFDIQDVGVRYYTYISTMGLAMQAAAEAGIDFLVLDRPNPLGGEYIAGFTMEPAHRSFVGQFAIPMVHGLTVGELARLIKGRSLMPGLGSLPLDVVAMEGWTRRMRWPDTGLPWQRTSPNVPSYETALLYAGMGLFESADASEGVGTQTPFQQAGTPWADGARLAHALASAGLPGVTFEPVRFSPRPIRGMVSKPRFDGVELSGVRLKVTDHASVTPVETGVAVFSAFARAASEARRAGFISRPDWLAKLSGTRRLQTLIANGADHRAIAREWAADIAAFKAARTPYLLYP
jgi:uncharacterized protein YbbC (DUF1343 family)